MTGAEKESQLPFSSRGHSVTKFLKGWIRIAFIITIAIPLLICAFIYFQSDAINKYRETKFCTMQDEVYQAIEANYEEWVDHFRSLIASQSLVHPAMVFQVPSGSGYTVSAELWEADEDLPTLFVVTEIAWQERFGSKGYFYSPSGQPSLDDRYQFQHLSGDVYCYRFKTVEE